jgi:hypothetical protein
MTRRNIFVILGALAFRRKGQSFDAVVTPQTKLVLTTDGASKTYEGFVVGLPQCRRETIPTYLSGADDSLTSEEWAKRVFFVEDAEDVAGASQWLSDLSIAQNDPGSCGCGEVSRHVPLTKVVPEGSRYGLNEDVAIGGCSEFFTLAASGARGQNGSGKPEFQLDEFWISPSEWKGDAANLRDTRISEAADSSNVCKQGVARVARESSNGLR